MSRQAQQPTASVRIFSRVPADLAERIERDAEAADRTVSAQIRHLVKKGIDAEKGVSAAA